MSQRGRVIWTPSEERQRSSRLHEFMELASRRQGRTFATYAELHDWSISDLDGFWRAVWDFCGVISEGEIDCAVRPAGPMQARWMEGARLNFVENLLRHRGRRTAVVFQSEDEGLERKLSFDALRGEVARCARALERCGVRPGDRVAAFTPNVPEAVVAMLAAASLGAIWSSCSPDFGPQGVFDRFGQIEPTVLFAADECLYGGKRHALGPRIRDIQEKIPQLKTVVVYSYRGERPAVETGQTPWQEFLENSSDEPDYTRRGFDHPLAILYSSGTTGIPKCILHGAGGTLLKHLEEHALHVDLRPDDVFFYFTTCGWMMWNWLVSGLATGATIVLYDGSPLQPDARRLFRMAEKLGVTVFGASPRYFSAVESAGVVPGRDASLEALRTVLSTGSPLHASQYEWIYRAVKQDVLLASISGGTDIIGCFVLGSPLHAVRAGEISAKALGMKVLALDASGQPVTGQKGELVCAAPFPSQPLGFWNDPDGAKFRAAYFEKFQGVWHHGDYIEIFEDGYSVIHGRSDATLNPGGVRIGTAEIYRALAGTPDVVDSLAVGRRSGGDESIVLFVVLAAGRALDTALEQAIRAKIRAEASPRHVPAEIHAVAELPRTVSGKSAELAVAQVLRGEEVKNRDALANPQVLDDFTRFRRPS
ncbi:MAG TPA: acetoacetate--CoA ligase [Planctomycetota bacterium]|nr:acetoacetate--CoA ligase [Planctomycetota bacterium]